MSKDAHVALALFGRFATCSEERSQTPLVPRERALNLPTLSKGVVCETGLHLPAISTLGPFARPARLCGNQRFGDPQFFAAQPMMRLAVVGGVRHHAPPPRQRIRVAHDRPKCGRVIRWPSPHVRGGPEMALSMAEHCQLGPTLVQGLSSFPLFPAKMAADVAAFEAGGVDDPFGTRIDQARKSCALEGAPLE